MTAELRFIEPRHQKRMVFYVFVEKFVKFDRLVVKK